MTNEIRPYGPGKFSTILDSYVYQVSLDGGCDDEVSDDNGTWCGLMRNGRSIFRDHDPFLETLNEAEQEKLTSCAGVILCESSDGFVSVSYYDTLEELATAWEQTRSEFAPSESEEGNNEETVNANEALDAIANLMSGQEWDADTISAVADVVRSTGRTIEDTNEEDNEEDNEEEHDENNCSACEPEPEEDSITTTDHRKFYQYGKLAFELSADEDTNAGIKRELDKMQFWPNVFFVSDHGNAHLIRYWEAK